MSGRARQLLDAAVDHAASGAIVDADRLAVLGIAAARRARDVEAVAIGWLHRAALAIGRGDSEDALVALERVENELPSRHPLRVAAAVERAFALLVASDGLAALAAARHAATAAEAADDAEGLGRARLALAVASLHEGDPEAAARAREAADALRGAGDERGALTAELVGLRAEQHGGRRPAGIAKAAGILAGRLSALGAEELADQARIVAARGHVDGGKPERASAVLAEVGAQRPSAAAAAAYGRALVELAGGNRHGARRALAAGLRAVERAGAAGPTARRTALGALSAELAELGTALALADRQPRTVLRWAERARANALSPPGAGVDDAPGTLGAATAVEFVESGGRFHAVVVGSGRATLHELGPVEAVLDELHALRFALRRLAVPGRPPASAAAAARALDAGALALDALLISPYVHRLGPRVVLVPTGALYALPWRALPGLGHRPFVVAPSLKAFAAGVARRPRGRRDGTLLVAGPHLPGARIELRAVRDCVGAAAVLQGRSATPRRVLAALGDARVAHIAAHGRFNAADPMSSGLLLSGATLTVRQLHDLADGAPDTVVLSACDAGLSGVHAGDELLGLGASFLLAGTRSLIAPVVPVPDAATVPFMTAVHDRMRRGDAPARALAAAARGAARDGAVLARAVASAFVSFGVR